MWRTNHKKIRFRNIERRRSRGFTLLELLVALSILSILATVLYLSIGASATQTRRIGERIETQQRLRLAIQKLTADISSIYWNEDSSKLFFEGTRGISRSGRQDRLEFTSLVFHWRKPEEKVDDLASISYSWDSRSEGGSLIREETPLNTSSTGNYGGPVAILNGVKEVAFSYINTRKQERNVWSTRSSQAEEGLPAAIRVSLRLQWGEGERTISTLIPLPMGVHSPENENERTGGSTENNTGGSSGS